MNVKVFSPALTLLYVFVLLWILMGIDIKNFGAVNSIHSFFISHIVVFRLQKFYLGL